MRSGGGDEKDSRMKRFPVPSTKNAAPIT